MASLRWKIFHVHTALGHISRAQHCDLFSIVMLVSGHVFEYHIGGVWILLQKWTPFSNPWGGVTFLVQDFIQKTFLQVIPMELRSFPKGSHHYRMKFNRLMTARLCLLAVLFLVASLDTWHSLGTAGASTTCAWHMRWDATGGCINAHHWWDFFCTLSFSAKAVSTCHCLRGCCFFSDVGIKAHPKRLHVSVCVSVLRVFGLSVCLCFRTRVF